MNEHVVLKQREAGYDTDFYQWTSEQVELLRAGRFDLIDADNIAEEIEGLGKSDRRGIESQLARLVEHLLKFQVSRDMLPRAGWRNTAVNARNEIDLTLDDSPSLRRRLPEFYERQQLRGYQQALAGLSEEDRSLLALIGPAHVFTCEQALNPDFFPGD